MHKRQLNHARLHIVLKPRGPLLIKSGLETPDPTRPGMEFVRTHHAEHGETVYLPGTSLKGAVRSHAERLLRGLGVKVCDPLAKDRDERCQKPPWKGSREEIPSPRVFRAQCPACRTFGSLHLAARTHLLDALPWPAGVTEEERRAVAASAVTETRWQVGIDRQTAQAQGGALFDLEVVVGGEFHTEVQLHNFQLWQLGLVAVVLRDMNEGHVPLGFGKFRGLGQVEVEWKALELHSIARTTDAMLGSGALCTEEELRDYDLQGEDQVKFEEHPACAEHFPENRRPRKTWRGSEWRAEGEGLTAFLDAVVEGPLARFVEHRAGSPLAARSPRAAGGQR